MNTKFKEIFAKTDDIIRQYPMVLLSAFLAVVSVVMAFNRDQHENQHVFVKFTLVCCLGISLFFALNILSQRIGKEFFLNLFGTIFLIGFLYILPEKQRDFTIVYGIIFAVTAILIHLLVSFIAFVHTKNEQNFWQYNKNLFINLFLTAVFSGILIGGVELAILAIEKLFDIAFDHLVYPKTFFILGIFGSCFIFLLFNEKGLKSLEKDGDYPLILKFFTQFILIPLLLIYAVILYFYSFKMLIQWQLPRGWVSYLVLAYSIVGILALLLVYPLREDNSKSWVKIFSKIFYYTLVPLIVLLYVAVFTRILEYGYTEARYYVLLLTIWLTLIVLYFIFWKKQNIKFIPISLFVFGLFSLIFPYFNTFSVAKRSQENQLKEILVKNNLLENGKINFKKKVTNTVSYEISNKFTFLKTRKDDDFLNEFLDNDALNKSKEWKNDYYISSSVNALFENSIADDSNTYHRFEIKSQNNFRTISGYDFSKEISNYEDENFTINNDHFKFINHISQDKRLKLNLNDKDSIDFMPSVSKMLSQKIDGETIIPEISTEGNLGSYHVKIIFDNLVKSNNTISYSGALLLIKKN